jgi:N4-gp56 family major capsid protein
MAYTNFAALTTEQKTVWSKDMWKQARNMSFINKFMGKDANSLIHHIDELKKTEKGARAVITLLTDLEGDGIAGDRTLEGNEEALKSFDQVIQIDQLRHANRHEGKMAEQKSVVTFRTDSRNTLAYWLSDRLDQLAFLTLAGIGYQFKNSGGTRVGSDLQYLEFAADVSAPTSKRYGRYNNTSKEMEWGVGSGSVTATDTPSWEMLVKAKAYAKDNYIRGVRMDGGEEVYHVFLSPTAMAKLKLDPTYLANLRGAGARGDTNQLFKGGNSVLVDGLYIHEFRHVPNTRLAASGSKYGAAGAIDGCQVLFCGAQALGMADIGDAEWVEKGFDFDNQQAIATGKIMGFLKPKFYSQYSGGTTEDFGVLSLYVAQ